MTLVNASRFNLSLPGTPEGWKAELTLVVGYIVRESICPWTVTHPSNSQVSV